MNETRSTRCLSNRTTRWLTAAIVVLQLAGAGAVAVGEPAGSTASAHLTAQPNLAESERAPGSSIVAAAAEPATEAMSVVPAVPVATAADHHAAAAPEAAPMPAAQPAPRTSPPSPAAPSAQPSRPAPPAPSARPAPRPAAPAPGPAAPPAQQRDPAARVQSTFDTAVPASWRGAIAVRFEIIEGNTSWASPNGVIQVARAHAEGSDRLLRALLAHEFGHLIAFRYGSYEYNGAAPEGWPPYSSRPEEAWADCVSRAFTGIDDPSHGLPSCAGESLSWTSGWLGAGPGAHPRTG